MQRLENSLYDMISTHDDKGIEAVVYFKKGTFDEKLSYKSDFRNMGCLHRIGGPAVEWDDGTKVWMVENVS